MRILLINPPWTIDKISAWSIINPCYPSIGLLSIAGVLLQNKHEVTMIDARVEQLSADLLRARLRGLKSMPDFIGLTGTTRIINNALESAKICKEIFPESKIVFGGVHSTLRPAEVLLNDFVDYVIRDEGEFAMNELVSGNPLNEILGLSYKKDGQVVHNDRRPFLPDLNILPFLPTHLLPMEKYHPALGAYKRLPAFGFIATRGCPGTCTYCYQNFGPRIRYFTARRLLDEIKLLQKNHGIREISFYDDTFTAVRKNVREFCELVIAEKVDITWSCFSRVDCVDKETLELLKKAGCHQIMYGVESADSQILLNIRKRINLPQVEEVVRMTKEIGINCRLAFMFGNPGETEETMNKTLNYALMLDPDLAVFNIATPYPGTEMYSWAKERGYLKTEDWNQYNFSQSIMELPTVSSEKVEEYYKKAFRKFYFRPVYILKHFPKIIVYNVNSFKAVFKFFFRWILGIRRNIIDKTDV
ncbi:B12-binding domain-containing radical SAM protein [Candidatus Parcubacteria bacterium]|nr:B12-binding domain-containing radical SAM protein [Candidatus Parcubacteria bacterium]